MSHWITGLVGPAAQVLLAGVFTFAALAKTLTLPEVAGTLQRLGARPALALPAAGGVVAAELAVGVGLLISPAQRWPRVLGVALAALLAVFACGRLPQQLRLWRQLRSDRLAIDEGVRPPPRKPVQEGGALA